MEPRRLTTSGLPGLATGVLAALLAGCASMAPPYQTPAPPVPAHWPAAIAPATAPAPLPPWRGYFTDPLLQQLV